jgi:hypothetical protein
MFAQLRLVTVVARLQHDKRVGRFSPLFIRHADHGDTPQRRVSQQRAFHSIEEYVSPR